MALLPDLETAEQAYERGWSDACTFISNQLEQAALIGGHPMHFSSMRAAATIARRSVDEATSSQ